MSTQTLQKWKETKFKDFVRLQRGFDLPKQDRKDGIYPVIASTSITGYHDEYKVEPPCVTTGRSGALGEVLFVKSKCWPLNTALWVKDFKGNDPYFVYSKLKTLHLEQYNSGAGVPTLNRNHLDQIIVEVPSLPDQKQISDILSTYDDLIENNTRRIQILEQMAQAIYMEWFVNDPKFKSKKVKLSEVVKPQYGYTESASDKPIGPKYLRGTDINKQNFIDWSAVPYCKISDQDKKKYQLRKGDIVIIRMADPGKIGIVEQNIDGVFASYLIRLEIIDKCISPYYLFYFLNSSEYQNYIQGASGGTTRKSASAGVVTGTDIVIPPAEILGQFEEKILLLRSELNNLLNQNANLRQTRDLLLPKLVTGEIRV